MSRGFYNKKSHREYTTKENFCGSCKRNSVFEAKLPPLIKEDFGNYNDRRGCNYSLGGNYSIMGNPACSCNNIFKACSCSGPCSCSQNTKENYCGNCGSNYNVFNYDMVECHGNSATPVSAIPTLPPYYFTGNSKLTIQDPDNALTYWLGGAPCPCKCGFNQPAVGRQNWFNELRRNNC
jgi:hypothetical protein